ncbi:flagellar export chaperone FliS [Parasphingorhabdus sp. JC815]|uniref:flagellar export chaperone FliS n=1 Tax=Parasphingorhabdus sp. JC815 TaxID=3232140 RepID=UPI00345A5612
MVESGYAAAGKEARVMNANAHELITILFEELLNLLDEIYVIQSRDEKRGIADQQAMALTIVDSLMISLDMEKGGDLAKNLHQIYSQVRHLIAAKESASSLENNRAAHQIISEIYSAWLQIEV